MPISGGRYLMQLLVSINVCSFWNVEICGGSVRRLFCVNWRTSKSFNLAISAGNSTKFLSCRLITVCNFSSDICLPNICSNVFAILDGDQLRNKSSSDCDNSRWCHCCQECQSVHLVLGTMLVILSFQTTENHLNNFFWSSHSETNKCRQRTERIFSVDIFEKILAVMGGGTSKDIFVACVISKDIELFLWSCDGQQGFCEVNLKCNYLLQLFGTYPNRKYTCSYYLFSIGAVLGGFSVWMGSISV